MHLRLKELVKEVLGKALQQQRTKVTENSYSSYIDSLYFSSFLVRGVKGYIFSGGITSLESSNADREDNSFSLIRGQGL